MFESIKFGVLERPLELTKTHDFCEGEPILTVVFLHGIASDSGTFTKALEYLEGTRSMRGVRFVTFDLLGAGKSYKSDSLEYNLSEQLEALERSLEKLKISTPLVLVGHSMGTLIAARYTDRHRREVKELILVSPPVYRPEDFENPLFMKGMEGFREVVGRKNREILEERAFNNELKNIVMNKGNYAVLARLSRPTTLIYGEMDQIIAPFNIPGLLAENSKMVAMTTPGRHGVTHDKYVKILQVLERMVNENATI